MKEHFPKAILVLVGIVCASAIWFPVYQSKAHEVGTTLTGHWSELVKIAAKQCGERPWHVYGENSVLGMQFKCGAGYK